MAEIRHLENRHDVIFCWGWSDLDKISQNGAEWHVDCGDVVKIETRCRIPIWRTFGRIPWHVIPEPPATLQGVIIQSAILKTVFGHIFCFFLMQFGIRRVATFVSSPIHLLLIQPLIGVRGDNPLVYPPGDYPPGRIWSGVLFGFALADGDVVGIENGSRIPIWRTFIFRKRT